MNDPVFNRQQARQVDAIAMEEYGIPGIVLMENAGRGCVEFLDSRNVSGPVLIVCGGGNNGGDGFVIARHLYNRGMEVHVLLLSDSSRMRGDAKTNFEIVAKLEISITDCSDGQVADNEPILAAISENQYRWIVDCVLGTGGRLPLAPGLSSLFQLINASESDRLAVDLPTGLDCDTGAADVNAFRATATCTFVAIKQGMLEPQGMELCGDVTVIDIGFPLTAIVEKI